MDLQNENLTAEEIVGVQIPLLALRGLCIFPGTSIHFDVGRKKSIRALEKAMEENLSIFLTAQQDISTDDPSFEDLYPVGTVAKIKQV